MKVIGLPENTGHFEVLNDSHNTFICSFFLQNAAWTQIDRRRKTVAFHEVGASRTLGCGIATMKIRTWIAALVLGYVGLTMQTKAPTTDVDVEAVLGHNLGDKFFASAVFFSTAM